MDHMNAGFVESFVQPEGSLILQPQNGVKFSDSTVAAHSKTGQDMNDPGMFLKVRGTSVLLVDDSADARALIDRYVRFSGGSVDFAENGIEGIKKALVNNYDIILMDIQMPRLDGLEATRKLRDFGYEGSIVAVTGHAQMAEREDCLEAGFDEYLTKPINRVRLIYTIACQPRCYEKPAARVQFH